MTDDLITDLSKVSGLIVIARNSVFTYKGKNVKVQEIAKDLGVTHVLQGTVRKVGNQVRINVQLIGGEAGQPLWAELFDGTIEDVFAFQDKVRKKIVDALTIELTTVERQLLSQPSTNNIGAYDIYLRATQYRGSRNYEKLAWSVDRYSEVLALEPDFIEALVGQSEAAFLLWRVGYGDVEKYQKIALSSINRAQDIAPTHPGVLDMKIRLLVHAMRHEEAVVLAQYAVSQHPKSANLWKALAFVHSTMGDYGETRAAALQSLEQGADRDIKVLSSLVFHFHIVGDFERALVLAKQAIRLGARKVRFFATLAAANVALGNLKEGEEYADYFKRKYPSINIARLRVLWAHYQDRKRLEKLYTRLSTAGLPEYPNGFNPPIDAARVEGSDLFLLTAKPGELRDNNGPIEMFKTAYSSGEHLCISAASILMGRAICAPVYRNPDAETGKFNDYIWPTWVKGGPVYFALGPQGG